MKIKIGHRTYILEEVDHLIDDEDAHGACATNRGVIQIDSNLHPDIRGVTLLHEVMHAVWDYIGLPDENEERIIGALDDALYAALKDNKDILFPQ